MIQNDFFTAMDNRTAVLRLETAQRRQALDEQLREDRIRREERLAPLRAACEDSGFTDITKALAALPGSDGEKFSVHASEGFDGEGLFFTIQYGHAGRSRDRYRDFGGGPSSPQNEICFEIKAADKITCTRKDHIVESPEMKRYREQVARYNKPDADDRMKPHPQHPTRTEAFEKISCSSLEQAIKEQLADWIASVAPDRCEELKQQMTATPVQAAVEAKTEAIPAPTLALVAAIGTPKTTGRIRRTLGVLGIGR